MIGKTLSIDPNVWPLMGLDDPTTSTLRVRRATHCDKPPNYFIIQCACWNTWLVL